MEKKDIKDIERTAILLCKMVSGTASDEERQEIERWADSSNSRRETIERLHDADFMKDVAARRVKAEAMTKEAEERMRQRIARGAQWQLWRRRAMRIAGAAAMAVLMAGAAVWYDGYRSVTPPSPTTDELAAIERIKTADMPLARMEKAAEGKSIVTGEDVRRYNIDEDFKEALENGRKLTTYVNTEYWTTLEDGTIVHLNGASRLIYPERFGKGQRDVILEGEAYFLVAQDKSRPFIVHTPNGDIKEYGTKFHVNTNAGGKGVTEVVLIDGSISVTGADDTERMLTPGHRAVMGHETTSIETADTTRYVAWHTGRYSFSDKAVGDVMDIIAHWYGYDLRYEEEALAKAHISGYLDRAEDIADIIDALENVTGLRIELKGQCIVVGE